MIDDKRYDRRKLIFLSEKYQEKIEKFKKSLKLGSKVKYTKILKYDKTTNVYIVLKKYDKFVLLQGPAYQTTARYEELLKRGGSYC